MRGGRAGLAVLVTAALLGCVGPFADTVDEALQDTPGDYDQCCVGADRTLLAKLAAVPAAGGAPLDGLRVDAVAVTKRLDPATERDITWEHDGDGLLEAGDTHEYVLALVVRQPGGDPKGRLVTTVSVGDPKGDPVRFEAVPLVDPSDGSPITSIIIAVRVPVGDRVVLTVGEATAAVDLRTGLRAQG